MPHRCPNCKDFHLLRLPRSVVRAYRAFERASTAQKQDKLIALAVSYLEANPPHDTDLDEETHRLLEEARQMMRNTNALLLEIGRMAHSMSRCVLEDGGIDCGELNEDPFEDPPSDSSNTDLN